MSEFELNAAIDLEEPESIVYDPTVTDDKPFNRCFTCKYFRTECSGPNLHAMSVERVCEFLQLARLQLHYTYQKVADESGLAITTVKRQLSNKIKDPSFLTLQALTFVLICDPSKKRPCAMHLFTAATEEEVASVNADLARAMERQKDDRKKIDFLIEEVNFYKEQMQAKDKIIQDDYAFFRRKNRVIGILSVALGIALALIVFALVVDHMNPNVGFFWVDGMSTLFGGSPTALPKIFDL